MFELFHELQTDEFRDILSEIDAGELDEQYLVKHTSDYGKPSGSHPLSTLKTIVNRWLNSMRHSPQAHPINQAVKTASRSATP